MGERPILFSGPVVRAILEGRKTQTRRVVKPVPKNALVNLRDAEGRPDLYSGQQDDPASWGYQFLDDGAPADLASWAHILCPYGQPGNRLWVRETWMDLTGTGIEHYDPVTKKRTRYAYGADSPPGSASDECRKDFGLKWRPSIHMPRWACRLVLEVTGVRVERLQAISEADAEAEGAIAWSMESPERVGAGPRPAFRELWTSINGKESWDANPWVWVVEFRRAEQQGGRAHG